LMARLMEKHNITMAMGASGVSNAKELDTQSLVARGEAFYLDMLRNTGNEKYQGRELVWLADYEPYAHEGPTTQFSYTPEALEAFLAFIQAPPGQTLSPLLIMERYEPQWTKFRCRQHALAIKSQVDALKRFEPQAVYALCSESLPGEGEDASDFFRRNGVDLRMMDPYVDMHLPMIYAQTAMLYRRIEASVTQLEKPVLPTITSGYGNSIRHPERLSRVMVAAAFLGAPGVYHWPSFMGMDGCEIQASQRAMGLIAELEPFIKHSQLLSRNDQVFCAEAKPEEFYYALRGDGNKTMLFMANDSKNKTFYPRITHAGGETPLYVTDVVNRVLVSPGKGEERFGVQQLRKGFRVTLPPNAMRILLFADEASLVTDGVIDTCVVERAYEAVRAESAALRRSESQHGMSYQFDGDALVVTTPVQTVKLNMNDCASGEWLLNRAEEQVQVLDFLGHEYLDYPAPTQIHELCADLENVEFGKDSITVVAYYKVTLPIYQGLAFRKTFIISRDVPRIAVNLKVIPTGGFRNFALRIGHGMNSAETVLYVDGRPVKQADTTVGGDVYTRDATTFTPFIISKHIQPQGVFNTNTCGLRLPSGNGMVDCEFGDEVKAVMHWHNDTVGCGTMELLYDKAYDHNDPHRAQTIEYSYTLKSKTL